MKYLCKLAVFCHRQMTHCDIDNLPNGCGGLQPLEFSALVTARPGANLELKTQPRLVLILRIIPPSLVSRNLATIEL